jgi:hypothetical protein
MAERIFYALVMQHDCNAADALAKGYPAPQGPILFERYLNNEHAMSEELTRQDAERFKHFGWTRVAKVIVDIPE